jgi:SNF2 family DNA or RNA helicase
MLQKYVEMLKRGEYGANTNLFQIHNHLIRVCAHPDATLDVKPIDAQCEDSTKMIFILAMIEECKFMDSKIIIFSSSLDNLDVIEVVLQNSGLKKNVAYYRIDGTTNKEARQEACDQCNNKKNKIARSKVHHPLAS